uniref:Uncharacterized protein n=1 Tax=Anguilla anguilla TaxID=7936 RepID=A0A0E9RNJ2_ANGAN
MLIFKLVKYRLKLNKASLLYALYSLSDIF